MICLILITMICPMITRLICPMTIKIDMSNNNHNDMSNNNHNDMSNNNHNYMSNYNHNDMPNNNHNNMSNNDWKYQIISTLLTLHHSVEFFIIYLAISILVSLINHRLNFLTAQLNAKVPHDTGQLLPVDEPVPIPIKYLESFSYFILSILSIRLEAHHHQKLWEVQTASPILVNLVDHIRYLCIRGVLPYTPHDGLHPMAVH